MDNCISFIIFPWSVLQIIQCWNSWERCSWMPWERTARVTSYHYWNTFVVSAILFDIIIVRPGADLVPLRTPGSKFQESSACGFLPTASLRNPCQLRCSFELPGSYLSLVGYENLINLFRDGRSWKYKGLTFGMLVTLRGFKRLSHW